MKDLLSLAGNLCTFSVETETKYCCLLGKLCQTLSSPQYFVYEVCPKKHQDILPFSSSEKPDPALSGSLFVFNFQLILKTRGSVQTRGYFSSCLFQVTILIYWVCFAAYPGTTLLMLQNLTSKLFVQGAKYFVASIPNPAV